MGIGNGMPEGDVGKGNKDGVIEVTDVVGIGNGMSEGDIDIVNDLCVAISFFFAVIDA